MSYLMMFPGQGSQTIGMLDAWTDDAVVQETLAEASNAISVDLAKLMTTGPAEDLNATHNTQPAMLAADVALWRAWRARGGPQPACVAGHSLGEYAAVVAAGCLEFGDAMRIARLRGEAMRDAVADTGGAMAAIIGMEDDAVMAFCAEQAQGGVLQAVNFNAPGQVVIAGDTDAVERALSHAKAAGARIATRLPVSVPAHSDLMLPARDRLAAALGEVAMHTPAIPLIQNTSAAVSDQLETVRDALICQVAAPVRWVASVQAAIALGATQALECGPGKVLTGLAKRIDRSLTPQSLATPEAMDAAIAARLGDHA